MKKNRRMEIVRCKSTNVQWPYSSSPEDTLISANVKLYIIRPSYLMNSGGGCGARRCLSFAGNSADCSLLDLVPYRLVDVLLLLLISLSIG